MQTDYKDICQRLKDIYSLNDYGFECAIKDNIRRFQDMCGEASEAIEALQIELAAMRGAANSYRIESKRINSELVAKRCETNLDCIRSLSPTDLAPLLIQARAEEDVDYDWDEESFVRGIVEYYETSDGDSFSIYEEALEHEIWWLNQNYKENTK